MPPCGNGINSLQISPTSFDIKEILDIVNEESII